MSPVLELITGRAGLPSSPVPATVVLRRQDGITRAHPCFRAGQFIVADCFNDASTFVMARKLHDSGKMLMRAQAAAPGFSMKAILAQ